LALFFSISKPIAATINGCEVLRDIVKDLAIEGKREQQEGQTSKCGNANKTAMSSVIEEILHTNHFMLVSINRCMDYAKVCDGIKLVPKLETCPLRQSLNVVMNCCQSPSVPSCCSSIVASGSASGASQHAKVTTNLMIAPEICSHIITDKHWFQENLVCLLSNAMKFTPVYGQIDIRLSLLITAKNTETQQQITMLLVEVEDTGIGIPLHQRLSLFEPFKQAQQHAGGTGLGLYSLSRRVQALGGEFGVSDRVDQQQGSRFWFTFPYRPDSISAEMISDDLTIIHSADAAVAARKDEASLSLLVSTDLIMMHSSQQQAPLSSSSVSSKAADSRLSPTMRIVPHIKQDRRRSFSSSTMDFHAANQVNGSKEVQHSQYQILLVDDSASMLKISSMLLTRVGHIVTKAENGLEALILLQDIDSQHNPVTCFDVMIIDLHMPVMDGMEAIRRWRAKENEAMKLDKMRQEVVGFTDATIHSPLIVIACSANDDEETVRQTKVAGADGFLTKPYNAMQFMDLMKDIVAARQNAAVTPIKR
jgi:CheY-like chemotaxis protein